MNSIVLIRSEQLRQNIHKLPLNCPTFCKHSRCKKPFFFDLLAVLQKMFNDISNSALFSCDRLQVDIVQLGVVRFRLLCFSILTILIGLSELRLSLKFTRD